jgi:hypothetical protein
MKIVAIFIVAIIAAVVLAACLVRIMEFVIGKLPRTAPSWVADRLVPAAFAMLGSLVFNVLLWMFVRV